MNDPAPKSQRADQGGSLKRAELTELDIGTDGCRPHVFTDERAIAALDPPQEHTHIDPSHIVGQPEQDAGGERSRIVDALSNALAEQDLERRIIELQAQ
jgi:hypothetical protein